MDDQEMSNALALMFRQAKAPRRAKEELRRRLLGAQEVSDDEMSFVSAAGEMTERGQNKNTGRGAK